MRGMVMSSEVPMEIHDFHLGAVDEDDPKYIHVEHDGKTISFDDGVEVLRGGSIKVPAHDDTPELVMHFTHNYDQCPKCESKHVTKYMFPGSTTNVMERHCNNCGHTWPTSTVFC